jgi:hypothetical protein
MTTKWREEQHPRRADGRFRRKTGGWVEAVADAVGASRGEHQPVRAHSIADDLTAEDWARLASLVGPDKYEGPDQALGEIYRMQGYHALPEVVPDQELDQRIGQGWIEIWRGFGEAHHGQEYHRQFREGDQHWPGIGVFGNGTYFTTSVAEGVRYASSALDVRDPDRPDLYPALARAAIRPDARVIEWDPDLKVLSAPYRQGYYAAEQDGPQMDVMFDLGRAAALLGFDVIHTVRTNASTGERRHNYVVLNRSVLAIRESP